MPGKLSDAERVNILEQLQRSLERFEACLRAVPDSLWMATPPNGGWSPGETAEHVFLTEHGVLRMIQEKLLQTPECIRDETALKLDAIIPVRIERRSGRRLEAPAAVRPSRMWPDSSAALTAFREQRHRTIGYAAATQAPLRVHTLPHPGFGELDGYQWLLFLAAHSNRHALQIEEAVSALTDSDAASASAL